MSQILKSTLILALGVTLGTQPAIAGANSATLSCKSKPGQATLTIQGTIPASEETLDLTLSDRQNSLKLTNSNAQANITAAFKKRKFSLTIKQFEWSYEKLQLDAIPTTIKVTRQDENSTFANFDATLVLTPPTLISPKNKVSKVRLVCSYKYEV